MPLKHNYINIYKKLINFFIGEFLSPQIIYGGKTDKCHPLFKFYSLCRYFVTLCNFELSDLDLQFVNKIVVCVLMFLSIY